MYEAILRAVWRVFRRFLEAALQAVFQWLLAQIVIRVQDWFATQRATAWERRARAADEARKARTEGNEGAAAKADADVATVERELLALNETEQAIKEAIEGMAAELPDAVSRAVRETETTLRLPPSSAQATFSWQGTLRFRGRNGVQS
jgi:hypothetical protein